MTTAFILAFIAALALAAILFFAINYIRKLERDNMRLARMWREDSEENERLRKELVKMGRWEYGPITPPIPNIEVELVHDEATGQTIEMRRFAPFKRTVDDER